jgi:hypothetical protein
VDALPSASGGRTIRTVTVAADLKHGHIDCRMATSTLRSTHYRCLSYVCGPDVHYKDILLNGRPFSVRRNLWGFLDRARKGLEGQKLWIDAVSIRQDDPVEKSYQVQHMGDIYAGAVGVVVWLGNDRAVGDFWGVAREVGAEMRRSGTKLNRKKYDQTEGEMVDVLFKQPKVCVEGLASLTNNPYWRRQWIVQEFILARHITFLSGSSTAKFEEVRDVVHLIRANQDRLERSLGHHHHTSGSEADEKGGIFFRRVLGARESHPRQMGREKLQRLMIKFKEAECYDARDRVYALLSLAEGGEDFRVDYGEDAQHLARRALAHEPFWNKKGVGKSLLQWALFGNERD